MFSKRTPKILYVLVVRIDDGKLIEYKESHYNPPVHEVEAENTYPIKGTVKIKTNKMTRDEALQHVQQIRLLIRGELKADGVDE